MFPLLYEINTRCWLRELSERFHRPVDLATVPESEFELWQRNGFTHLWLMGVWTSGPQARARALNHESLKAVYDHVLPGWTQADVGGSPYAVADYTVPEALGGEVGLMIFRQKLRKNGMKLILDFVSNHTGVDHSWVRERPELFISSEHEFTDSFPVETKSGRRWIAHGKDPYFPAWTDTAQLNFRQAETRVAMAEVIQSIACRCDGIRCDMAMLLLDDVIQRTWSQSAQPHGAARPEFWKEAIDAVRAEHPDFIFLAEVYWGLEERLESLGFDYTYDKGLFDLLTQRHVLDAVAHVYGMSSPHLERSAHFLENHDEERVAPRLSYAEHRAAALLILALPGMRFLHEGQLTGATMRLPVQLTRRNPQPPVSDVVSLYEELLGSLKQSAVGQGIWRRCQPRDAGGNGSFKNFVILQWQKDSPDFDLVVVNLASHRSQCFAPLEVAMVRDHRWRLTDRLGKETHERCGLELATQGLYLDVPAHGAQIFHFKTLLPIG